MSKEKKPDWWPKNPYPEDIFPMPREDYAKVVSDPDRRTALSGMLGREFWGIASRSIWDALRDHLEDLEDASSSLQPPALPASAQARIEAAIRWFENPEIDTDLKICKVPWTGKEGADLIRWVLGQEQDTWTDKDFGLEEEKEQEEK